MVATKEFLSVKQEGRETLLEFKSKIDLLFQSLEILKVTLDDLKAIKYLTGLKPTIVNTISVRGGKEEIDYIYKAVSAFDQRESVAVNDDEDNQYITPSKIKKY